MSIIVLKQKLSSLTANGIDYGAVDEKIALASLNLNEL